MKVDGPPITSSGTKFLRSVQFHCYQFLQNLVVHKWPSTLRRLSSWVKWTVHFELDSTNLWFVPHRIFVCNIFFQTRFICFEKHHFNGLLFSIKITIFSLFYSHRAPPDAPDSLPVTLDIDPPGLLGPNGLKFKLLTSKTH